MTAPQNPGEPDAPDAEAEESPHDEALRSLVRRALKSEGKRSRGLLRGVQARIRARSGGRFFADGWSTGGTGVSPALVALVMLIFAGIAYAALGPMGLSR